MKTYTELIAYADSILSDRVDNMPVIEENIAIGKRVHKDILDGKPVIVCYQSFDGLYIDDYIDFLKQDLVYNLRKITYSSCVNYTQIESDGDF